MASDHPTAEELTAYRGRVLAPIDLLRVSDHLAECNECRQRDCGKGNRDGGSRESFLRRVG